MHSSSRYVKHAPCVSSNHAKNVTAGGLPWPGCPPISARTRPPMKYLLLGLLLTSPILRAQDVLRLAEGETSPPATLQDLRWLVGHWVGTGLGGTCDEVWLPAMDNTMPGVFRYVKDGTLVFSEYMMIEHKDGTLKVRLKHFNRDLSPWEEKDKWVEFKLVKIENQTAYFHGLTYQRTGDTLVIKLSLRSAAGAKIEEFRFTRAPL